MRRNHIITMEDSLPHPSELAIGQGNSLSLPILVVYAILGTLQNFKKKLLFIFIFHNVHFLLLSEVRAAKLRATSIC